MRLPILLVLLSSISGIYAATEPDIKPINLTRCGKLTEKYIECHVEASCLYGERKRETPMFLRRYYEKFHGKKNLTEECKTVVVVRSSPAAKLESVWRNSYEDKEIRRFESEGWIDPVHFTIGVRFMVGQKIVMLREDDGFSDDDDWLYASHNDRMYPVFNGTFKPVKSSTGVIHFTLTAQAYRGPIRCRYAVPYYPGQPEDYCFDPRPKPPTPTVSPAAAPNTTSLPSAGVATGQQQQAGEKDAAPAADGRDAAAQQNAKAKSGDQAQPATGGLPMFVIVIAIIAAVVCVVAVGAGGYYYVRRRRANKQPKTERTQSETASLIEKDEANPEGGKPVPAAPSTPAAAAPAASSSSNEEAK